jgi:hypothetical protein
MNGSATLLDARFSAACLSQALAEHGRRGYILSCVTLPVPCWTLTTFAPVYSAGFRGLENESNLSRKLRLPS